MSHIETVKAFQKARKEHDTDACVLLMSDNVQFTDVKDGTHEGKEAVGKFLRANKPLNGTWDEPVQEGDKIVLNGTVAAVLIKVKLRTEFSFDASGKISQLKIQRA